MSQGPAIDKMSKTVVRQNDPAVADQRGVAIMAVSNEALADLVSSDGDDVRIATDKKGRVLIGSPISGTFTPGDNKTEDTAHATGDIGSFVLGVRNDADASLTSVDGGYSPFAVDAAGRTKIRLLTAADVVTANQGGAWSTGRTWALTNAGDSVTAFQGGTWTMARSWTLASGSDSVSAAQSGAWTVAATQSGVWSTGRTWVLSSATDSIAATQSGVWTVSATQSGAWSTGRTWTLASGTDSVNAIQGTSPWVTNDPGLPDTLGQKLAAASTSVVLASDQPALPVLVSAAKGATASVPSTVAITNAAIGVQVFPASNRVKAVLRNADALNSVFVYWGAGPTTAANCPIEIGPGDVYEETHFTGEIRAIALVASVNVARQEVTP